MLARSPKAFTMLELIVVIVILGILAAIAIPTFKTVIDRSKTASIETTARSLDREARALAAFENRSVTFADVSAAAEDLPDAYRVNATNPSSNVYRVGNGDSVTYLTMTGTAGTISTTSPTGVTWSTDDLQTPAAGPEVGLNLLTNSGYDDPIGAWTLHGIDGYSGATVVNASSGEARTGASALKITTNSAVDLQGFVHNTPVGTVIPANTKVISTAWVKGPKDVTAAFGGRGSSVPAGGTGADGNGGKLVTFTGEWQQVTTDAWTLANDFRPGVQLRLEPAKSGVVILVDDVTLSVAP